MVNAVENRAKRRREKRNQQKLSREAELLLAEGQNVAFKRPPGVSGAPCRKCGEEDGRYTLLVSGSNETFYACENCFLAISLDETQRFVVKEVYW